MTIINNLKKFFQHHTSIKGRILEVTIKRYYVIPEYERMTDDEIYNDWFVRHTSNSSHAYRDASSIGDGTPIAHKMLSTEDINSIED
jgi:hypothetical protein